MLTETEFRAAIPAVVALVRRAGEAVFELYQGGRWLTTRQSVSFKADQSPVTVADLRSNEILLEGLRRLPDLAGVEIVSEEGHGSSGTAPTADVFWMVDPLDGTQEFLAGVDEFTVNVALIQGGEVMIGVVGVPALGLVYSGTQGGGGAHLWVGTSTTARKVSCRRATEKHGSLVALVSRRHAQMEEQVIQALLPGCRVQACGSSLKLCRLASGDADIYLRCGPTKEWDTAAGQGVLEAAGGSMVDFSEGHLGSGPLQYGKADWLNPAFLAVGDPVLLERVKGRG